MELALLDKSEHVKPDRELKKTFTVLSANGDGKPHEESFEVWYAPFTEEVMALTSPAEQLARVITRWTLTEGGQPVPITREFFASRPLALTRFILDGLVADYFPSKKA